MEKLDRSQTWVFAEFGGERRKFQLTLGGVSEMERLCGAGVGGIMYRLGSHTFYQADVREPLRLGLEGGGMTEGAAAAMMRNFVDPKPLATHMGLAMRILESYVNGIPADNAKKKRVKGGPQPSAT